MTLKKEYLLILFLPLLIFLYFPISSWKKSNQLDFIFAAVGAMCLLIGLMLYFFLKNKYGIEPLFFILIGFGFGGLFCAASLFLLQQSAIYSCLPVLSTGDDKRSASIVNPVIPDYFIDEFCSKTEEKATNSSEPQSTIVSINKDDWLLVNENLPKNTNVDDYTNAGFYFSSDDTSLRADQIRINYSSSTYSVTSEIQKGLNLNESLTFVIDELDLDYSSCLSGSSCDTQLFFGIGDPDKPIVGITPESMIASNPNYGLFLVFRKYREYRTNETKTRICILRSLKESCLNPVPGYENLTDDDLENSVWKIILDKKGKNVTFHLEQDEKEIALPINDTMLINDDDLLSIGFNIKSEGRVETEITILGLSDSK
jgi:hypothetical protein